MLLLFKAGRCRKHEANCFRLLLLSIRAGQHESKRARLHYYFRSEQDSTRATVPSSIIEDFLRSDQDHTKATCTVTLLLRSEQDNTKTNMHSYITARGQPCPLRGQHESKHALLYYSFGRSRIRTKSL